MISNRKRSISGLNSLQIAFPLGGIGAGCICINGEGGLQDFSIRNRPDTTALPDEYQGKVNTDAAFALLHLPQQGITRLVEGPMPPEKKYNLGTKTQGYRSGGHEGLPRLRDCSFKGEFPFAQVNLSDPQIPLAIEISAFNPFIPLDDRSSGLPCAILEYALTNTSAAVVPYEFSFHLSHLAPGKDAVSQVSTRNAVIPGSGVFMYNREHPGAVRLWKLRAGVCWGIRRWSRPCGCAAAGSTRSQPFGARYPRVLSSPTTALLPRKRWKCRASTVMTASGATAGRSS